MAAVRGDHPAVHQHVDEQRQAEGAGQQPRVFIARLRGDPQAAADHRNRYSASTTTTPIQPKSSGQHREHEIGGVLGQVVRCDCVPCPSPCRWAAATNGDLALDDVPSPRPSGRSRGCGRSGSGPWSGRVNENQRIGANIASENQRATAPAAANHHHDTPARNSTNTWLASTSTAVPRSMLQQHQADRQRITTSAVSSVDGRGGSRPIQRHASIIGRVSLASPRAGS